MAKTLRMWLTLHAQFTFCLFVLPRSAPRMDHPGKASIAQEYVV
jgi:hypothetical protein